jgi:hypothetical protein
MNKTLREHVVEFCLSFLGVYHIWSCFLKKSDVNWNSFHIGILYFQLLLMFCAIMELRRKTESAK